ncbi:hypothetical protein ARC78_02865 [Stenotrophomonas pictorum JCM 9942]|uniref:Nitroreductase domain-containing protein n=1 Tax=Stenotrophomonas pictorum JCM 9942 TaxID=1236960 RepID=A0A0R0AKS8_9GAMM|nr:putative peptide maturation dehydrogenase [Stenotrophomonas pictorum]KRG45145.1 hypothetical protein ARC78_02865 [Stenotrophomonas pictorum JCM 9942]
MEVRRCSVLFFEPLESASFSLAVLLGGGDGLERRRSWRALAPHLSEGAVDVADWMVQTLGQCSPSRWSRADTLSLAPEQLQALLDTGLLVSDAAEPAWRQHREADERLREANWWPLAAAYAARGRWSQIDSAADMERNGTNTIAGLVGHFGTPRPEPQPPIDLRLGPGVATEFDAVLRRRVTCRNFSGEPLPLSAFQTLMERVFAATHVVEPAPGLRFLKRSSPSGGGLHATDAYLLVQQVEGVPPGLYRYLADSHSLSRLPSPELPLDQLATAMVAGQHWFSNAPVMVALVATYRRSFWKYRNHTKAYRALVLDAGHLSQTLYLSATEMDLGAFVTAAVNEHQIEQMFGLDALTSGVIAVCGFGRRRPALRITEFDPGNAVWPATTA